MGIKQQSFPLGVSTNEILMHDTKNYFNRRIFKNGDMVKLDFGFHYDGYTVDSAETFNTFENADAY